MTPQTAAGADAERARLLEVAQALQETAAELASTRDPTTLLERIAERAQAVFAADACVVWLVDEQGGWRFEADRGLSPECLRGMVELIPNNLGFDIGDVPGFQQRTLGFTRDLAVGLTGRYPELAELYLAEGLVSELRLPLVVRGELGGGLTLFHRCEVSYSDAEIQQARAFADQIAVALRNARLSEQERLAREAVARQLERTTQLTEITKQLLAATELDSVFRIVAESSWRLCGMRWAAIALRPAGGDGLVVRMRSASPAIAINSASVATAIPESLLVDSSISKAMASGQTVMVTNQSLEVPSYVRDHALSLGAHSSIVAPLIAGGRCIGVLTVNDTMPRDIAAEDAALVQAFADQAALAIEQARLIEDSRTLQALAAELASTRDPGALLEGIVERVQAVFGADGCLVWSLDGDRRWRFEAHRGLSDEFLRRFSANLAAALPADIDPFLRLERSQPSFDDTLSDGLYERQPVFAEMYAAEGLKSALRFSMVVPGQMAGAVVLYSRNKRWYGDADIRQGQAFADQIAVALNNARLSEQERRARAAADRQLERLTRLAEITKQLLVATELDTLLRVVVESAAGLCDAAGAVVGILDPSHQRLVMTVEHGAWFSPDQPATRPLSDVDMESFAAGITGQVLELKEAIAVEDYDTLPLSAARDATIGQGVRAMVAAPLLVGGDAIGMLWVCEPHPRAFSAEDIALVQALADQAALAIEQTRLLRREQDAAVLEERSRLARDLHDSVTQSLFSMTLIADALPKILDRRPEQAVEKIGNLGELGRAALDELRGLIFELRPAVLTDGLSSALSKHVAAFQRREGIAVELRVAGERRLPDTVEEAIFRVAQEALNNISKHAKASRVTVHLSLAGPLVELTVTDDGAGFDLAASPTGRRSLGMTSMRERAAMVGGSCTVESAPGAGSTVRMRVPVGVAAG
jgi:signal transduction histidine kinase